MSPIAKEEYTQAIAPYYRGLSRSAKKHFLTRYCRICGYSRKHAIAKLNRPASEKPKNKPGKKSFYEQEDIITALRTIWKASDYPCSKRLKSIIPEWLPHLDDNIPSRVKKALKKISPATIDRILKPHRLGRRRRFFTRTKPGKLLKIHIPIKTEQWNEFRPGFLESDTVALCGTTLLGDFINTLDTVDIASGWTQQRAVFGKSAHSIVHQIKDIERSLPFKILGFDSDNGNEFFNKILFKYFTRRPKDKIVDFTRSRPYRKDDNAHVEQKNWTHVRQWLGYDRFDNPAVVDLLNDLYKNEWSLYHNFFQPSMKLISKDRVASKIVKKHDLPKTPYKRLLESKYIDAETKNKLKAQYKQLNPFKLKITIEEKLKKIFALRRAPGN